MNLPSLPVVTAPEVQDVPLEDLFKQLSDLETDEQSFPSQNASDLEGAGSLSCGGEDEKEQRQDSPRTQYEDQYPRLPAPAAEGPHMRAKPRDMSRSNSQPLGQWRPAAEREYQEFW